MVSKPASKDTRSSPSPGRPKDLVKRAAILDAAERMFLRYGFEGTSMDQIANEAGVSKLTVYSHFGDKDKLFAEAARSYCEQQMPTSVFDPAPGMPLRERLLQVAEAFFAMVSSPEAISGHRLLCTPQVAGKPLTRLFWEAGPARIQRAFAELLQQRVAAGELEIPDLPRAAAQFFVLVKGEPHLRMVIDCCDEDFTCAHARREHLEAGVDMFLRAYGTGERPR